MYTQLVLDVGPRRSSRPPTTWASRRTSTAIRLRRSAASPRRLSARDGQRLRDDRLRWHPQPAERDHEGEFPDGRSEDLSDPRGGASRRCSGRRHRRGDPDPEGQRLGGTGTTNNGCPAPARPAPPTASPTPGSSATPRACRHRRLGRLPNAQVFMSGPPHRLGGRRHVPAEIWGDYMTRRKARSGDFTEPKKAIQSHRSSASTRTRGSAGCRSYYGPGTSDGDTTTTEEKYDPLLRGGAARSTQDRDAARAGGSARVARKRERERKWERQQERRRRPRHGRAADATPGRARADRSYRGHAPAI